MQRSKDRRYSITSSAVASSVGDALQQYTPSLGFRCPNLIASRP
jgi:hypothetical protein